MGNNYNVTKCGLNFIAISNKLGQRFTPQGVPQPAAYVVSGLTPCDSIEKAYLYVEGSGTGAAQTAIIQPPIGGPQNFPLTLIGTGPDKCWGYASSVSYRADVTAAIQSNGTYNLSNIFTNPPNVGEDMDGATLIIIYSDKSATYQGTLIIDDGAMISTGFNTLSYNMNYGAPCGPNTNAQAFCCIGDLQNPSTTITMNGTPTPYVFDWWNYLQVPTTVTAAQTTSNFTAAANGDCYNLCVVGMYWQTTTCATCPSNQIVNLSVTATSTQTSCTACTGTATANPTPAGSYTYSWNPSGQTTQTATNLCAGTYTVTVSGSCLTGTTTVTVPNSANLTSTSVQTNILCNGGTGDATVTPNGGQGPYTYSWSPSGGTSATASGLSAGSYTCTVTDANGCTTTQVANITQPPVLGVTMANVNVLCNGQTTGSSTASVTGGSPNYTYAWSPSGGNAASATNLAAGNYTLTVTDANGCVQTQPVTITQPAALTNAMTVVNVGCSVTGSATANISGGTGPYTYSWSNSVFTAADNNLAPGSYTVTVTDANGCTLVDSATILSITPVTSTQTSTNITCFGSANGSGTVTPSGGTSPYTYSWSPTGGNNATATNLAAGVYTVTITDANGCTATATITITQPTQLTSTSTSTNILCNGQATGSGTVTPAGGTPGYTYSWAPSGGTNSTANNLAAGTYTVTATDANGCVTTQTITLTQPPALTVATVSDSVCLGSATQIAANGAGGVGPYTYAWSNGQNTQIDNVNINTTTSFTVTVTDANGCTTTGTSLVTVNPDPVASISSNAINGVYTLVPNQQLCFFGPAAGVTAWDWILQPGTSNLQDPCVTVTAIDTGTYCAQLIVQNIHGCTDTANTCVEIVDVSYSIPNVFTPNGDGNNDVFLITNTGMKQLHCIIYDRWGVLIYEWDSPTGYWDGKTKGGGEAVDGVYYWTLDMTDYVGKTYGDHGFVHLIRGGNK